MNNLLKKEQKGQWQQHRFLKIIDFLSDEEKKALVTYANDLVVLPEVPGKWMKYFERNEKKERQLCRVENFLHYHEPLKALLCGKKMLQLLSTLMGEEAVLFKEKMNVKYAGGNGFTPHQDAPAFISFNQTFHITVMIAIDEATLENGCLQVVENDNNAFTTLPQEQDGSIKRAICEKFKWKAITCNPGDILLFDSYLPHFSKANHSDKSRRALFVTYNRLSEGGSKREAYFKDKREHFPPDCEREPNKDYSAGAAIYNVANPIAVKG